MIGMVSAELVWGETGFEVEDSLRVADGDLGEIDELAVEYFCQWPNYKQELLQIGIEKGKVFPGVDEFYTRTMAARREGSERCVVSISAAGMSGGFAARKKRTISAFGQIVSIGPIEKVILVTQADETGIDPETGDPVEVKRRQTKLDAEGEPVYKTLVTPSGSGERWNISEAGIKVVDVYFSKERPLMTGIKRPFALESAPEVPENPWIGYNEPMRGNHPYGWVLDDRQLDEIIEGKLWQVTDTVGYYLDAVPA